MLLQAAGLSRAQVGATDAQIAAVAGAVLRTALAGLTRLARDRRKARADLGLATELETPAEPEATADTGSTEALLRQLLVLAPADAAAWTGALCTDVDAHQRAVLAAMQASLHHALDQFSPASIKTGARGDAQAWKAYERAFDARDGFVDIFAQAFARAYGAAVGA